MNQKLTSTFLVISIFMLMSNELMALPDCVVPDSVIPPNWCKFPSGVTDPTSPKIEHGSAAGSYALHIDDRILTFFAPPNFEREWPSYSPLISTRSREAMDWLRVRGEFEIGVFGIGWNFYWLGIPLLDQTGFMYISAKLHVKTSPSNRDPISLRYKYPFRGDPYGNPDRGDFSKPEEMQANMDRFKGGDTTPVEEVIINNRKWYRYFLLRETVLPNNIRWLPSERYLTSREYYVTGLAPDRYLEVKVEYSYNPYQYSDEGQRPWWMIKPWWMKKASEYKKQVINSLRITRPEGGTEPDLYEVDTSMSPTVSTGTAPEQ
jgi:hypothetical protein